MLKKLIKYELKSTSKEFSILYITFFILTIVNKIYFKFFISTDSADFLEDSILYGIFDQLYHVFISTYYFLCVGIFFITFAQILIRFYKNLIGNEGYLTFTLPVPTWMIILSKLISAVIWLTCSLFIFLFSQIFLFWSNGLKEFLEDFISEFIFADNPLYFLGFILFLLLLITIFAFTAAESYFCIAIGHLSNKHRIVSALITFFIYNFIKTFLISCLALPYMQFISNKVEQITHSFYQSQKNLVLITYWNLSIGILIILILIVISILSFVTIRIFQNHLNLE